MNNLSKLFSAAIIAIITIAASTTVTTTAVAQQQETPIHKNPSIASLNKDKPRTGFISYDIRADAEKGVRDASPFYLPLKMVSPANPDGDITYYITQTQIPYGWLDRDLFIHIEGSPSFRLYVNDKFVGYGTDSKAASEFELSKHITNGINTIRIESLAASSAAQLDKNFYRETSGAPLGENIYLHSQPKLRIVDYKVTAAPDSLGKNGMFDIEVIVSNSYNADEKITIGYDIYSPQGKLQYYDMKEIKLSGRSRDTIRFREPITGSLQNLWSAESPSLYRAMLYVRRDGRMTEYIPFKVGFGHTTYADGKILRNGKPIDGITANYNAATTSTQTRTDLTKLKSSGVKTILVDYPQSDWFYDLCDEIGLYVIDQANINNSENRAELKVGGTLSNDPKWLNSYIERIESMYARQRNHPSIVAWSLAGKSGNGFNMQRGYKFLKGLDSLRAVTYRDAQGEWNNDVVFPRAEDGYQIIINETTPKVIKKPIRRR